MSELEEALGSLRSHPGVEHVLVIGSDGLLIQHVGDAPLDAETVSAMVPGLAAAASSLGAASGSGDATTVVTRFGSGVGVIEALSSELLLAVLLRGGTAFGDLLREIEGSRTRLATLL